MFRSLGVTLGGAALLALASIPARADAPATPPYESTVSGNSNGAVPSASATTLHPEDFELRPRNTPNDILNAVPGLLVVQHQGGGKADQLFLRGFDADHGTDLAIFVDGVPVNLPSHAHGQGYADLNWLIPEAISRIEVEKGPYDARYGDFATAGVINLYTRDSFPSSSVQLTLDSFPSISGRALAGERVVGIAAPKFSGWAAHLHPWLAFEAARDDGPFVHAEDLSRYNLFSKLSYDLAQRTSIGAFFQAYGGGWIGSGQIPARLVRSGQLSQFGALDPSEGGQTQRQELTAFLRHRGSANTFDAAVYVTRYRLSLWNDFTFFLEDPVNGSEIEQDDARTYSGARLSWTSFRHLHSIVFRTTLGADARFDGIHVDRWDAESQNGDFRKRLRRHVDMSDLALSGNDDDISQQNVAGYVEEDIQWTDWLRTIGALRADWFGFNVDDHSEALGPGQPQTSGVRQKALLSPKASVVFAPIAHVLDLYLNFGMGFHTNQAEVALEDGAVKQAVNGDGTSSSFTIASIPRFYEGEVGARAHLFRRVELSAAFWASYLQNETVFDADHAAFAPAAPTRRLGVDVDLRAQILAWLFADYELAQASAVAVPDRGNGGAVALAPRLYMTGGLSVVHPAGVRAGLRFRYLGDRPAFDESSPEYQYFTSRTLADGRPNPDYDPARVVAEGYALMDAYVAYRWRFFEAQLTVQNLLDSAWREAQFGNHSCTRDEAYNPANPNYAGSGNRLADGSYVDRCGIAYGSGRSGVTDVHFTPGVPVNLQFTLKAYF